MNLTRRDTKKVRTAVSAAAKKVEEAIAALDAVLVLLPDAERASVPRVRSDFPAAGRALAKASADHPDLVALTEYDAEAVIEDLDNVAALADLDPPLARLGQMISDSRLLWLAEAYVPSLALYAVAKVRGKKDGKLEQTIAPLADVLSTSRKKSAKPQDK